MNNMKLNLLSAIFAGTTVLLTACGGGDNDNDSPISANVEFNNIQNPVVGTPSAYTKTDFSNVATDSVVMTYKMKGINGNETLATALVFTPKTAPPVGGWPIIAWAHGTTGGADNCAPTRMTTDALTENMISKFLADGYVIVAPDYEGLGEPSGKEYHPYLNVKSAAYSVIDAVVATKNWLGSKASNKWVVAGVSQGGHAALATAQYAARAKMDYKGAVAFAPASNLRLIENLSELALANLKDDGDLEGDLGKKTLGYAQLDSFTALIIASLKATHPNEMQYNLVFKSPTDEIAKQVETECSFGVFLGFLNGMGEYIYNNNMSLKGYPRKFEGYLDTPIVKQYLDKDSQPLQTVVKTPIIIYQGGSDTTVLPQATDALVAQARALTTKIDYRTDPSWNHGTVIIENIKNGKFFVDIKTLLAN
jgi:dienelactone hydrolase